MTTTKDLIDRCRTDFLLTGTREQLNKLAGAMTSTATTATLTYDLQGVRAGSRLTIELEDMHVWDVNVAGKEATVERGVNGTVAVAHAVNTITRVNPRFADSQILRTVNDELHALSSPAVGLYQIRTTEFTYQSSKEAYNFPSTDLLTVWDVHYESVGPSKGWPRVDEWEHTRNANTTAFPAGDALAIRSYVDSGRTVRVWYRSRFAPLATLTDNVETISGIPSTATDLLTLGAGIRLVSGREIHRNFDETQGDTRRADEVPPGANLQSVRGLLDLRRSRVREEASRLARLYPDRW